MNRDKILFQYDIESKLNGLELQRERILSRTETSRTRVSPVHDVDFYVILLRRLFRQLEDVARYDSRVANLKGRNNALVKKVKIRDHFEHGVDLENMKSVDVANLPSGTISAPEGTNIKIAMSLFNNHIVSGDLKWDLGADHQAFVKLMSDFVGLHPFSPKPSTRSSVLLLCRRLGQPFSKLLKHLSGH